MSKRSFSFVEEWNAKQKIRILSCIRLNTLIRKATDPQCGALLQLRIEVLLR